ncbi:HAD family hydrolase [Chlorogloeopsis sp. ULAP02]|uniref:HAD family hydrolase n=1 Tax=Chlorogloeopsis sp. ULAP02 TaxID=3107926 RepID=UPI003135002D
MSGLPKPLFADPLSSWNQGAVKQSILDFVSRVTTEDSPDFLPPVDRIATFDNDGTLWPEKPIVELYFALTRLEALAAEDPSLKEQPFKAALERDIPYFLEAAGHEAALEVLAKTHANMSQEQFEQEARKFFEVATHPRLGMPITQIAFRPMVELLEYLRANQFVTWICSGGTIEFIRIVAPQIYSIPLPQVIGSSFKLEYIEQNGVPIIWRGSEIASYNDRAVKPTNIATRIGKRPVFAAGNVFSGGDIQMLRYSQGQSGASFQLLVHHDDADREFAYDEKNNASLEAAKTYGWTIVSIKNDWKTIFHHPKTD